MILKATALSGVVQTEPLAVDLKKVASLETGDVVSTLAGPVFRVVAKTTSGSQTVLRLSNLAGQPVDLTAEKLAALVPLSPLFTRIAARFRLWALQYGRTIGSDEKQGSMAVMANLKFSEVIKQALQQAGLPIDPKMNWDAWFNKVYLDRLYNNSDVHDRELIREVAQDTIIRELWDRGALGKFQASMSSWKPLQQFKDAPPEKQVSEYLKLLFGYRYSDAVDMLRRMSNAVDTPSGRQYKCEDCGKTFFSGSGKETLACPNCKGKNVKPIGGSESMNKDEEGAEDAYTHDLSEEDAAAGSAFETSTEPEAEESMRWEDIMRFAKVFSKYLDKIEKPKKAQALKILFQLMLESAQEDTAGSHSKRMLYADEWMKRTGLSHDAFKLYIRDILRYLETFVDENPEFEKNYAFVQLLKQTLNKKRKEETPAAEPKASSLVLAGVDPYANSAMGDPNSAANPSQQADPAMQELKDKSAPPSMRTVPPGVPLQDPSAPKRTIPPEIPGQGGMGVMMGSARGECGARIGESTCTKDKGHTEEDNEHRDGSDGFTWAHKSSAEHTSEDMQAAELGKHCTNCGSSDVQTVPQAGAYIDICKGCGNVGEFSNFMATNKVGGDLQIGDEVRARIGGGAYFNGEVSGIKEDGSINVTHGKITKTFPREAVESRHAVEQEKQKNVTDARTQAERDAEEAARLRGEQKSEYSKERREELKANAIRVTDAQGDPEQMARALQNEGYKLYLTFRELDHLEHAAAQYEEWTGGEMFDESCAKQYDKSYADEWHLVYDDPGGQMTQQYGFFDVVPSGITGKDWRKGPPLGYSLGDKVQVQRREIIEPLIRAGLRVNCGGSVQEVRVSSSVEKTAGFEDIRPGDRVTIRVPAGMGRNGQEWTERSGKVVMRGSHGWVLNMGGAHGTPGIATPENFVAIKGKKGVSDMYKEHYAPKASSSKVAYTDEQEDLLEKKYAEECPACGAISAYDWNDANFCDNCTEPMGDDIPEANRIYHIGAASGFEWECGKCRRSWTPSDSPLNSETWTHNPTDEIEVESSDKTAIDAEENTEITRQMSEPRGFGEQHFPELDAWWQGLDQGAEKPLGYGPAPDDIVLEDMGGMLAQNRQVRSIQEGYRVAEAWRDSRWSGIDFNEHDPAEDLEYHQGAAPLRNPAHAPAPTGKMYEGEKPGSVCSNCGKTVTMGEYESGESRCCKADVTAEEFFGR